MSKTTFRTTISLNAEQYHQMSELTSMRGCSQADVMRLALDQYWNNNLKQEDDLDFIIQMKDVIFQWLNHRGFTRNLGTTNENVSRFFDENIPFNFMRDRGSGKREY